MCYNTFPTVGQTAFAVTTALGVATIASVGASATAISTAAAVAFGSLAVAFSAISVGSMIAFSGSNEYTTPGQYLSEVCGYSGYAIAGTLQVVGLSLVLALLQGAEGFVGFGSASRFGPNIFRV